MPNSPTRKTSETDLNQFNLYLRQQPWYQQWFTSQGLNPNKVKLSEMQRSALVMELRKHGINVPDGMKIDEAGNFNQKNTLGRNLAIGAAIGGGALTGLGFAGLGPLSGLGGGAAAGGAGAGAGAAESIPTLASTQFPSLAVAGPSLSGAATAGGGLGAAAGGAASMGGSFAGKLANGAMNGAAQQGGGNLMNAAMAGLAGLPGLFANRGQSQQETAFEEQARRLLAQQEQRTNYQNPLYQAVTQMAYDLLPKRSGNYPGA